MIPPTNAPKPDADEIRAFVKQELPSLVKLDQNRNWWTQFAFHFTDINNAVNILEMGRVYSRLEMQRRDIPFIDGASREVIAGTSPDTQDMVRLFFRPRTPTQFRNEGIRPTSQRELGSHLPVPVFLLFDLADVLSLDGCVCSDQSAGKSMFGSGASVSFIKQLPFARIYHDAILPDDPRLKAEIKAQRHAEIMIPRELDLSGLREIHCRSKAEKDTLLHLLPDQQKAIWQNFIYSDGRRQVFYKRWTYIDRVILGKQHTIVEFSPDTQTPGPFTAIFRWDFPDREPKVVIRDQFDARREGNIAAKLGSESNRYTFTITLNGDLVYKNEFVDLDIPF